MNTLLKQIKRATRIAITGHVRPDGDCVGSTLALYNYILDTYENKCVVVCLESPPEKFSYLRGFDKICEVAMEDVDLLICLDASDRERLGDMGIMLTYAKNSMCIDHHITNTNYAIENIVVGKQSSTCELLYTLLEDARIGKETATCLYTGIIHDTGVFKYPATTAQTMRIAGLLMEKGVAFGKIIDESFYAKTFMQNKLLALALDKAKLVLDGKCTYTYIEALDFENLGLSAKDTDGIIDALRNTTGVEIAFFLYAIRDGEYKVSLRSAGTYIVSGIATVFGGGGHEKAAGCSIVGERDVVIERILAEVAKELGHNHE